MVVGNVIPLKLGAVVAVELAIAVGLPTVGSVSYSFHVPPVPNVPLTVLIFKVPVVTPLQTPLGLAAMLVGFTF